MEKKDVLQDNNIMYLLSKVASSSAYLNQCPVKLRVVYCLKCYKLSRQKKWMHE
jgi:hypothetical protein